MIKLDDVRTLVPAQLCTKQGRYVSGLVLLLVLPFVIGTITASQILVFAIFAMGYNLLLGYGGEMSFGHAAYFGTGAYGLVLTTHYVGNVYLGIVIGIGVATLFGAMFGWLSLRRRGLYFAMITLALGQMIYFPVRSQTDITGGTNGISIPHDVSAIGPLDPGTGGWLFYGFLIAILLAVWLGIRHLVYSPYGRILIAIRENEQRAEALGYDSDRILFIAFVLSSAIAGMAGVLYGLLFSFITPEVLFWTISGEVVLMTVIGGLGTFNGPIIGSAIFIYLSQNLTQFFDVWEFFFGLVIIVVVILAPEGVYGLYLKWTGMEGQPRFRLYRLFRRWYERHFEDIP